MKSEPLDTTLNNPPQRAENRPLSLSLSPKSSQDTIGLVRLLPIGKQDLEKLRIWKNAHRHFFFHQEIISAKGQQDWYRAFSQRSEDFMFLVEYSEQAVGCIGFRIIDKKADIYNAILGLSEYAGKGIMSLALRLLCSYARSRTSAIGLKVLKENPAVQWYKKNGFMVTAEHADYFDMVLDWNRFNPVDFNETSN
jgi:ribosomal protein S18 acetylase RimI-like enzyme